MSEQKGLTTKQYAVRLMDEATRLTEVDDRESQASLCTAFLFGAASYYTLVRGGSPDADQLMKMVNAASIAMMAVFNEDHRP